MKILHRSHGRRASDTGVLSMLHHRYFIARLYVALSVLLSILSIVFEPSAIHTAATSSAGIPMIMIICAIGVCAIAIIDAFVNDFLPVKYKFTYAYHYRHLVYMALALISFSLSAGLLVTYGGSILIGRLWLDGLISTIVAVLDLFSRHRENSWLSGTH